MLMEEFSKDIWWIGESDCGAWFIAIVLHNERLKKGHNRTYKHTVMDVNIILSRQFAHVLELFSSLEKITKPISWVVLVEC